jgi:hypothetical protein
VPLAHEPGPKRIRPRAGNPPVAHELIGSKATWLLAANIIAAVKLLRWVLFLVLSVSLPLYTLAGVRGLNAHCPMPERSSQLVAPAASPADGSTATPAADGGHDCCADLETFAKTGKPCKPGFECQAAHAVAPPSAPPEWFGTAGAEPFAAADNAGLGAAPAAVWHPPRLP